MNLFDLLAADPSIDPALRAFMSRAPIGVRGSERQQEVMADELADQRRDERAERIGSDE